MRIIPNPEAVKRLRDLAQALPLTPGEKAGPVLNALTPVHIRQVERAFATNGASTGEIWPAWSAKYAAWRRKHAPGNMILQLTGRLKTAITHVQSGAFFRDHVLPDTYRFGFYDQIGAWHVNGTENMPVRDMLAKTIEERREFIEAFFEFWKARTIAILRSAGKLK